MSKENINIDKKADELLILLKNDYLSTHGKDERDSRTIDSVPKEALIWNLFNGKYSFSYRVFKTAFEKLNNR